VFHGSYFLRFFMSTLWQYSRSYSNSAELDQYDAIVIGAGAAGLAAARRLQDAKQKVLVVEAHDRIGGRIQTSYELANHPVELGAEFVHGEVLTLDLAQHYGMQAFDVLSDDRGYLHNPQGMKPMHDYHDSFAETMALGLMQGNDSHIWDWVEAWVEQGQPDTDLASMLKSNGIALPPELHKLVDHTYSADYGVYLHELGVYGLAESTYLGDGCGEYRIKEGYSWLLKNFAAGLDMRLGSPVQTIDWQNPQQVVVTLKTGESLVARQVIITVPLAILQKQLIDFVPALPDGKQQAIAGLGVSHIIKLILKFDAPFWPEDWEHCHTTLDTQLWWRPGWGRATEEPVLTAFVGSAGADRIRALGTDGAAALGVAHLEAMFGISLAGRLVQAQLVDWQADPYVQMGYSHTPPHATGLRDKLAAPVQDCLFFAGEATNTIRPATVHGAFESGFRAATEVLSVRSPVTR
jgi:monoamine oxidase